MQITIKGEMTIANLRQAIYEALHEIEDDMAVAYSKGATLYVNPSDGAGQDVVPRRDGRIVSKMVTGQYRCAADDLKP